MQIPLLAVDAVKAVIRNRIFDRVGELPAEQRSAMLFSPADHTSHLAPGARRYECAIYTEIR